MALDNALDQKRLDQLTAMKTTFAAGQYQDTLKTFEDLGELKVIRSGIRIEAVATAARAHAGLGERKEARRLLQLVWNSPLKSHRLYRHVAIACLELGEYKRAIALIEKAAELSEAVQAERSNPSK